MLALTRLLPPDTVSQVTLAPVKTLSELTLAVVKFAVGVVIFCVTYKFPVTTRFAVGALDDPIPTGLI